MGLTTILYSLAVVSGSLMSNYVQIEKKGPP